MKIDETFSEKYLRFQKSQGVKSVFGIGCGELECAECALHRDNFKQSLCLPANAEKLVEFINDWANRNPLEREIDWSKVPIDTPVLVRNDGSAEWLNRYFAMYLPSTRRSHRFASFLFNAKCANTEDIVLWDQCKLVEDNPAYYKDVEDEDG